MNPEEIERISRLIERNNATIDRSIASYIQTLRRLMQSRLLRELSALPSDRNLRRAEVLRLLGGLESIIMDDEDIIGHIESLQDIFDLQSRLSESYIPSEKPSRSQESRLAVFVNSRQQNVAVMARAYANEVRQGLADSIISQTPVSDFELTEVRAPRIFSALENDLKTATASYNRLESLALGSKYVLYAGPRDARNRPFCAERVNNIYPVEVVYTWDNGQGIPAYLYCGGYGCRHQLIPTNTPPARKAKK
jgi:hypothetical protein